MRLNKQFGFTLLELIIVITIGGILTAIALPNYQDMILNNCLTTKANTLVSHIQLARSEAAKSKEKISIIADPSGGWSVGWITQNSNGEKLRDAQLSCSKTTITETGGNSTLVYKPSGFIDSSATFNICDSRNGETGRQVTINAVGRPNTNTKFNCS